MADRRTRKKQLQKQTPHFPSAPEIAMLGDISRMAGLEQIVDQLAFEIGLKKQHPFDYSSFGYRKEDPIYLANLAVGSIEKNLIAHVESEAARAEFIDAISSLCDAVRRNKEYQERRQFRQLHDRRAEHARSYRQVASGKLGEIIEELALEEWNKGHRVPNKIARLILDSVHRAVDEANQQGVAPKLRKFGQSAIQKRVKAWIDFWMSDQLSN